MKLNWFKKDKPGMAKVGIEVVVKNLKDMEKLERTTERLADNLERAAGASEKLADALERAGMGKVSEDGEARL